MLGAADLTFMVESFSLQDWMRIRLATQDHSSTGFRAVQRLLAQYGAKCPRPLSANYVSHEQGTSRNRSETIDESTSSSSDDEVHPVPEDNA